MADSIRDISSPKRLIVIVGGLFLIYLFAKLQNGTPLRSALLSLVIGFAIMGIVFFLFRRATKSKGSTLDDLDSIMKERPWLLFPILLYGLVLAWKPTPIIAHLWKVYVALLVAGYIVFVLLLWHKTRERAVVFARVIFCALIFCDVLSVGEWLQPLLDKANVYLAS